MLFHQRQRDSDRRRARGVGYLVHCVGLNRMHVTQTNMKTLGSTLSNQVYDRPLRPSRAKNSGEKKVRRQINNEREQHD